MLHININILSQGCFSPLEMEGGRSVVLKWDHPFQLQYYFVLASSLAILHVMFIHAVHILLQTL